MEMAIRRTSAPDNSALAVCALLAIAILSPAHAAAVFVPGDNDRTLNHAGNVRSYRVHVPPAWTGASPAAVVIDIHGWTSNAAQQQALSGLRAVSDREGFFVVWPQGLNNLWNAGTCCGNPGLDDVGFLRAVVDAVAAEGNVDRRRVYATGLSNGGAMSHKLACEASDVFAAAAPMAFPLPYSNLSQCQPARPIPILMVMGLTDALIPYNGGSFGSAPATFARWRDLHGCGGTPELAPHGQGYCETFTAAMCDSGREVSLCSIVAQAFPGQFFDGHLLYLNADLNLAEEAWRFLSQFRQPAVPEVAPTTLSGVTRLRFEGRRAPGEAAAWEVAVGGTSWMVETNWDTVLDGIAVPPASRRVVLALDDFARSALRGEIEARVEALTGAAGRNVVIDPSVSLKVRLAADGTPRGLSAVVKLLRDDGSNKRAGRFVVKGRRP